VGVSSLDLGDASLKVGKQVSRLQVSHVDSGDLGQSHTTMGADQWGNSRNGGKCGEMHSVKDFVSVLRD
jgi:hypothetical protein